VAFAGTGCHEALRPADVDLSEEFLYWGCKQRDRWPLDERTTLLAMAETLSTEGQSAASLWPYRAEARHDHPGYEPSGAALADARARMLPFGAPIAPEAASLLVTLDAGSVAVLGLDIHDSWREVGGNGLVALLTTGSRRLGGHAVAVLGYRGARPAVDFIVRNSWGPQWGDRGHGYLPAAYVDAHGVAAWRLDVGA
jgi:hypothetical protein